MIEPFIKDEVEIRRSRVKNAVSEFSPPEKAPETNVSYFAAIVCTQVIEMISNGIPEKDALEIARNIYTETWMLCAQRFQPVATSENASEKRNGWA